MESESESAVFHSSLDLDEYNHSDDQQFRHNQYRYEERLLCNHDQGGGVMGDPIWRNPETSIDNVVSPHWRYIRSRHSAIRKDVHISGIRYVKIMGLW